ncbi:hypothetical protein GGF47_001504, partial [Coemansia sp. RSA 2524]
MELIAGGSWRHVFRAPLRSVLAARWYSQYPKLDDIAAEDIAAVRRFREKFTRDAIPHKNFTTTFHRSGGAGGQNVNK